MGSHFRLSKTADRMLGNFTIAVKAGFLEPFCKKVEMKILKSSRKVGINLGL